MCAFRTVDMELLALKLLGKGTLQLDCDRSAGIGVYITEVDAGVLGIDPELGNQLIVTRLVAGDLDIDVLAAQEQENQKADQQHREQNDCGHKHLFGSEFEACGFLRSLR